MKSNKPINYFIKRCQRDVNAALKKKLPSTNTEPRSLHRAMRYSVLSGGKRIRAAFVYAVGEALGAEISVLHDIGAAIEMIHAYSLIHDDLPAIDNDDLRRGIPTCHKKFGESTAILAGDALQSLAFEILSQLSSKFISSDTKIEMIRILANAIGSKGMIGGEQLDVEMVGKKVSIKKLEQMFHLKTGCLLTASIMLGALASNCHNKKILTHLQKFGMNIGLAFQIHDDIIGILSSTKQLGKKQGADLEMNKPAYPSLVGMEKAKRREKMLYEKSMTYLDKCNFNTDKLKLISAFIIERDY